MEASLAIQVLPFDVEQDKMLAIVDEVIAYIESKGLVYEVGAFETTIEGDLDQLVDIIRECQVIAGKAGAPQVASYMKLFYKPEGGVLGIHEKVDKHRK